MATGLIWSVIPQYIPGIKGRAVIGSSSFIHVWEIAGWNDCNHGRGNDIFKHSPRLGCVPFNVDAESVLRSIKTHTRDLERR
ncbi:hypothetical protein BN13_100040 [Nostocoides jenkinsii Ben 74]|uniref:Uncharacterized protein n=1 Tax=Nostocoides jenkinsii Ben 74 TaxID=1193518 RepID=A0A077M2S7_9MICO|nr:hypothetical protein BN13_100040 [Tetrasphaera jenkinsii Ben 74]